MCVWNQSEKIYTFSIFSQRENSCKVFPLLIMLFCSENQIFLIKFFILFKVKWKYSSIKNNFFIRKLVSFSITFFKGETFLKLLSHRGREREYVCVLSPGRRLPTNKNSWWTWMAMVSQVDSSECLCVGGWGKWVMATNANGLKSK